ncbi:MAG: DEAD/DEAH box helicase [Acidimicrobiales bacterium]
MPAHLVSRLEAQGISEPFPIQAATIADALAGRDVCGRAPTGSGKTLAFGLVLITRTGTRTGTTDGAAAPRRPRALVLVPTRELAAQVRDELAALSDHKGRRVLAIYGGTGYGPARRALDAGVDVVVACPGRLEDLVAQRAIDLGDVRTVVLDEADRMADMGFLPAVRRLLDLTADDRQVLLFSATIGREVESIIDRYQRDPVRHDVDGDSSSVGEVSHLFWRSEKADRVRLTARLVTEHGRAIVFCRTKRGADRVARQLTAAGVRAVAIHGDRTQSQRERALAAFVDGRAVALVATDVAARGIHIDDLPCVVHFDPPAEATDYVHRSGRTGRAGSTGTVVTLVTEEVGAAVRALQRALGLPQQLIVPGEIPDPVSGAPALAPVLALASAGIRDGADRREQTREAAPRPAESRRRPTSRPRTGPRDGRTPDRGRNVPMGTVKFFDVAKGYGFVSRPGAKDLFVHSSQLGASSRTGLRAGQKVEFEIVPGRKGDEARSVRVV